MLGLVAGFVGGWVNTLIMRVMDVFWHPLVLLAVAISGVMGGGVKNGLLALTLVFIPPLCRVSESGDDADPQPRFRRGGARERRIDAVDHLPSRAAQRAGAGADLCLEPDLRGDPAGGGPVVPRAGRGAADRGLGPMLSTLRQSIYVQPVICALAGVAIFVARCPSIWSATGCVRRWM